MTKSEIAQMWLDETMRHYRECKDFYCPQCYVFNVFRAENKIKLATIEKEIDRCKKKSKFDFKKRG